MIKHIFMKVSKVGAFLGILSTCAFASSGFYGGLSLGGAHLSGKHNLHVNRNSAAGVANPQNFQANMSDRAMSGEIFAGYEQKVSDLFLGLEAHFGLTRLETEALLDISGINVKRPLNVKSDHGYGAAVHFGYPINPQNRAYVKLGFEIRKFVSSFRSLNHTGDLLLNHSKTYYSTAFVPGFGIETEVTPIIHLRTEYKIALHPAKLHQTIGTNPDRTAIKSKPTVHHVTVGFNVKI